MFFKQRFVLTELGEETVAVPMDASENSFHGIVRMNETGVAIFRALQEGGVMVFAKTSKAAARLTEEYSGLTPEQALADVRKLADKFREAGLAEEAQHA